VSSVASHVLSCNMSWRSNLKRSGGGFWQDDDWYDLNVAIRIPGYEALLTQLLRALPPLGSSYVCDLLAGSGTFSQKLVQAYPRIHLVALDQSQSRLEKLSARIASTNFEGKLDVVCRKISIDQESLWGAEGSFDVIVGTLALHVIVGHNVDSDEASKRYSKLFLMLLRSLRDGGHLIFGDHCGTLPAFDQMLLMHTAGFVDVDVAWREGDCFVIGGRKPQHGHSSSDSSELDEKDMKDLQSLFDKYSDLRLMGFDKLQECLASCMTAIDDDQVWWSFQSSAIVEDHTTGLDFEGFVHLLKDLRVNIKQVLKHLSSVEHKA